MPASLKGPWPISPLLGCIEGTRDKKNSRICIYVEGRCVAVVIIVYRARNRLFWRRWEPIALQIGTVKLSFQFMYVLYTYKRKFPPKPNFYIGSYITSMVHASWPAKIALFFAYFSVVKGGFTPPITHALLLYYLWSLWVVPWATGIHHMLTGKHMYLLKSWRPLVWVNAAAGRKIWKSWLWCLDGIYFPNKWYSIELNTTKEVQKHS